ncbi:DinB family protein [Dokdonia ponticola]|uniref:DinB family protein n=1 Tax=Dokdonia ponticola TaxID=2041041 RepID=A0ABV9HYE1_9FLAO
MLISSISLAQNNKSQESNNWTAISQEVKIEVDTVKQFVFRGYVKATKIDTVSYGSLFTLIELKNGEWGSWKITRDTIVDHLDWKEHVIEGEINKETSRIVIGAFVWGDVTFYFDNFQLEIEDDKGDMIPFSIGNYSFEKAINDEVVDSWFEGITAKPEKSVKEFEIVASNKAFHGKQSIKVTGSGTDPNLYDQAIKPEENYKPQLGVLISMLDQLKKRVRTKVIGMTDYEIDHLHDDEANSIGALVMHLAAAEVLYQVRTFENRGFNKEEEEKWGAALSLGDEGRKKFRGKPIDYYLEEFDKVRAHTKELFKTVDEDWLQEDIPEFGMNKYYGWFHVMEHQSSHLGQILFLSKRIPPEPTIKVNPDIKN